MDNTDNPSLYVCLGQYIRNARKNKGVSGYQLGKKINLSQQQISRYERGSTRFELDTLIKIFKALDVESYDVLNIFNTVIKKQLKMNGFDMSGFDQVSTEKNGYF